MTGMGTVMNVAGILAGGLGGLAFEKKLEKRYQDTLMNANGICVLFLGIGGCMENMLAVTEEGLKSGGTMMMIGCFALGALLGEWMNIEGRMEKFREWLKKETRNE